MAEEGEKTAEGWGGGGLWDCPEGCSCQEGTEERLCLCVQRTSLPQHRSIVEALLPRLTVGPHSHLSPYTGLLVSS